MVSTAISIFSMDNQDYQGTLWKEFDCVSLPLSCGYSGKAIFNDSNDVVLFINGNMLALYDHHGALQNNKFEFDEAVIAATFSHDHSFIAIALNNGFFVLTDYYGTVLKRYEFGADISAIALQPDDKGAAIGLQNGKIKLINFKTDTTVDAGIFKKTLIGELKKSKHQRRHSTQVRKIGFRTDGRIVSLSSKEAIIWNSDGSFRRQVTYGHSYWLLGSSMGSNSKNSLFSIIRDGDMFVYNLNQTLLYRFHVPHELMGCVTISPDRSFFAAGTFSGEVYIWNQQGMLVQKIKLSQLKISSITFSPNNTMIGVRTSCDGSYLLRSIQRT